MTDVDDASLIQGLKKGDDRLFDALMARYKVPVYRFLRSLTGEEDVAQDLTQETFVKVYFKGSSVKGENLKAWIFTIATNLARSEFRKQKIRRYLTWDEVPDPSDARQSVAELDAGMDLSRLLGGLPEKYRIPLVMKEGNGFSYEEIGEVLNKPVGTVKSLVFRAKALLRQETGWEMGGERVQG